MAYVYLHKKESNNEVFYVGVGTGIKHRRANDRCGRNKFWKNIVNKHGVIVEIYIDDISAEAAFRIEKELISQYGRKDLCTGILCNLTDGGEGIENPSRETREKKSAHSKRMWQQADYRKAITDKLTGIKRSEETKKKVSDSRKSKGIKLSKEHSAKFHKHLDHKRKMVVNIDTEEVYESVSECAAAIGAEKSNLIKHMKGVKSFKRIKKQRFKYYEA